MLHKCGVDTVNRSLFLVHWNQVEAVPLAEGLIASGWQVEIEAEDGARAAKRILADPPAAVVIYLTRLPSHGRETARYLRSRSNVPIIFVDGAEEKLEGIRTQVPDALFVQSGDLHALLADLDAAS